MDHNVGVPIFSKYCLHSYKNKGSFLWRPRFAVAASKYSDEQYEKCAPPKNPGAHWMRAPRYFSDFSRAKRCTPSFSGRALRRARAIARHSMTGLRPFSGKYITISNYSRFVLKMTPKRKGKEKRKNYKLHEIYLVYLVRVS